MRDGVLFLSMWAALVIFMAALAMGLTALVYLVHEAAGHEGLAVLAFFLGAPSFYALRKLYAEATA